MFAEWSIEPRTPNQPFEQFYTDANCLEVVERDVFDMEMEKHSPFAATLYPVSCSIGTQKRDYLSFFIQTDRP